jgi:hypothetical protein
MGWKIIVPEFFNLPLNPYPMSTISPFKSIEKEAIAGLQFPDAEVLNDPASRTERESELKRALTLGNLERSKSKIYFEDDKGFHVVETTVWAVTDKRIILKQGNVIPIKRVHKVAV